MRVIRQMIKTMLMISCGLLASALIVLAMSEPTEAAQRKAQTYPAQSQMQTQKSTGGPTLNLSCKQIKDPDICWAHGCYWSAAPFVPGKCS